MKQLFRRLFARRKVVHKQRWFGSDGVTTICGLMGNLANHSSWKRVTCRACKRKGGIKS